MKHFRKLSGLYLVVSPILPVEQLLFATEKALDGGVDILQLSAGKETEDMYVAKCFSGGEKTWDSFSS